LSECATDRADPVSVADHYRHRAVECEKLAKTALTDEQRQTILSIAATWRALADQHDRLGLDDDGAKAPR
jgi:hypothetical protein